MAPEMLAEEAYGFGVDIFALGVIIFTLLTGYETWHSLSAISTEFLVSLCFFSFSAYSSQSEEHIPEWKVHRVTYLFVFCCCRQGEPAEEPFYPPSNVCAPIEFDEASWEDLSKERTCGRVWLRRQVHGDEFMIFSNQSTVKLCFFLIKTVKQIPSTVQVISLAGETSRFRRWITGWTSVFGSQEAEGFVTGLLLQRPEVGFRLRSTEIFQVGMELRMKLKKGKKVELQLLDAQIFFLNLPVERATTFVAAERSDLPLPPRSLTSGFGFLETMHL